MIRPVLLDIQVVHIDRKTVRFLVHPLLYIQCCCKRVNIYACKSNKNSNINPIFRAGGNSLYVFSKAIDYLIQLAMSSSSVCVGEVTRSRANQNILVYSAHACVCESNMASQK